MMLAGQKHIVHVITVQNVFHDGYFVNTIFFLTPGTLFTITAQPYLVEFQIEIACISKT